MHKKKQFKISFLNTNWESELETTTMYTIMGNKIIQLFNLILRTARIFIGYIASSMFGWL